MLKVHGIIILLKMIMNDHIYKKNEQNKSQENTIQFITLNIPTRLPIFIWTEKWLTFKRVVLDKGCGKDQEFDLQATISLTSRDSQ